MDRFLGILIKHKYILKRIKYQRYMPIRGRKTNLSYIKKYIKYNEYIPIRTLGRKSIYKCENNNALSRHIRGAKKKVLKWTQQLI